jgi:hypothetical protein
MKTEALLLAVLSLGAASWADEPPEVDHQPVPCTIPDKPFSLCAGVSDDNEVAKARVFFRRAGEDYYAFVDMQFDGIKYCATLPAPLDGKVSTIEYYVQAIDNAYQAKRTSTYQIAVQAEGVCEFPPVEKDASRASSIKVYATHKKQGKKLDDAFSSAGVTFVPNTPAR